MTISNEKVQVNYEGIRMGLIICDYHKDLADAMLNAAQEKIRSQGAEAVEIVRVPGAMETPLASSLLLEREDIDGVIVLGAVVKGGTGHDSVVAHTAAKGLMDVMVAVGKPIGFGITGPNMTREQAEERACPYAERAVEAVLKMINHKDRLQHESK